MSPAPRRSRYNKGRWLVQCERLHLDPNSRPESGHRSRELGDVLPSVLAEAGLDAPFCVEQLEAEWAEVVGEQVAAHSRPGLVQGETLYVYMDSAAWLSEVQRYGQRQMLRNVGRHPLGKKIRRLQFRLDPEGPARTRRGQG